MAFGAVLIKAVGDMVRIDHRRELSLVAAVTGVRSTGIAGGVAGFACCGCVRSGKRESGGIMTERRWQPGRRAVAFGAVLIKVVRHVVRIGHRRKLSLVAAIAGGRSTGVTCRVTGNARHTCVRAGEREERRLMVKGRRIPDCCRVAVGAVVIEIIRHVIRAGHRRKLSLVAAIAGGRSTGVTRRVTGNA